MSIRTDILEALHAQNPWWAPGSPAPTRLFPRARALLDPLLGRLVGSDDRRATLLVGPRQVGKSVLLLQLAATLVERGWPASNITLFDFEDHRIKKAETWIEPAQIADFVPEGSDPRRPRILLLDEIHWAREWPVWLKKVVDRNRSGSSPGLRILATDSAASFLRHGTRESGQGRWDEIRIHGLSFSEYLSFLAREEEPPERAFWREPSELERYLSKGGLPEHVTQEVSGALWHRIREDIVGRAISRDLFAAGSGIDGAERLDLERLKRLFVLLIQDSGAIFNASDRAADLGAHRTTVSTWVQLLEDACLVTRIEPWLFERGDGLPKAKGRLARKPKIHASEHGLIPAFVLSAFPMQQQIVRDRVSEAVVLRHLRDVLRPSDDVSYYRRNEDLEIDFVFGHRDELCAIEVTSSTEVPPRKIQRFQKACEELGANRRLLIHGGAQELERDGARLVPLHRFLLDPQGALR